MGRGKLEACENGNQESEVELAAADEMMLRGTGLLVVAVLGVGIGEEQVLVLALSNRFVPRSAFFLFSAAID